VPEITAFRALRYDPERVADLDLVVAPPYDVISPARRAALAGREAHNIVHVDLPEGTAGEDPEARYARAGRAFAAWRADGILRRDDVPAVYVHEQTFALPGSDERRVQRGFYARVRLEHLAAGSGIRPHERTMSGPKEDRLRLMRATGANLSGVVAIYSDPTETVGGLLDEVATTGPAVDVVDDDGVTSQLWVVPEAGPSERIVAGLRAAAATGPITIADGHHRYETALRYRDERRAAGLADAGDGDAPFDHVLMLLLDTSVAPPVVLPTHRVVRGLGAGAGGLAAAAQSLFAVRPTDRAALVAAFRPGAADAGGRARFGLWTRSGGAILEARPEAFEPYLPDGGPALRRLDVTLLAVALERLAGVDREATASGGRIAYTHSVEEALGLVDAGEDGADAAFLLEATRAVEVAAVAAEGDVMPQKSTFFFPKPLTGLVINPLEW
jgi:uncharacterized protein (DUF1015 family)